MQNPGCLKFSSLVVNFSSFSGINFLSGCIIADSHVFFQGDSRKKNTNIFTIAVMSISKNCKWHLWVLNFCESTIFWRKLHHHAFFLVPFPLWDSPDRWHVSLPTGHRDRSIALILHESIFLHGGYYRKPHDPNAENYSPGVPSPNRYIYNTTPIRKAWGT